MTKRALFSLFLVGMSLAFAAGWAGAAKQPLRIVDDELGYQISAPLFGVPSAPGNSSRFMVFGPPSDGFAPNVNLTLQPGQDLESYRKVSADGFKAAGVKLLAEDMVTVGKTQAVRWEYQGQVAGRELRFLALAVPTPARTLLVTCTATPKQYEGLKKQFRECLDSLELTDK